jgi:hypothetical protein
VRTRIHVTCARWIDRVKTGRLENAYVEPE